MQLSHPITLSAIPEEGQAPIIAQNEISLAPIQPIQQINPLSQTDNLKGVSGSNFNHYQVSGNFQNTTPSTFNSTTENLKAVHGALLKQPKYSM